MLRSALVVLATLACSNAFMFDVTLNDRKCFTEFLDKNTLVTGTYQWEKETVEGLVVDVEVPRCPVWVDDLQVTDFKGDPMYKKLKTQAAGKFAFTTSLYGDYSVCFAVAAEKEGAVPADKKLRIALQLKNGVEAKDYTAVVKTEHLTSLELDLRKMEDIVYSVHEEMQYMKLREARMRDTNESTHDRVGIFALFSLFVLFSLTVWQLWHLKRFFQEKKII